MIPCLSSSSCTAHGFRQCSTLFTASLPSCFHFSYCKEQSKQRKCAVSLTFLPHFFFHFVEHSTATFPVSCLIKSPGRACQRRTCGIWKFKPSGLMGNLFFTQCQVQPEAGGAVAVGCNCGVHVCSAMLVKYLHGHEFSICQGLFL